MSTKVLITDTQKVYQLSCDVDVQLPEEGDQYHISDLIYIASLKEIKKHEEGLLRPGSKINVKLLVNVIEIPEEINEIPESNG